jgi:hypothetical protein
MFSDLLELLASGVIGRIDSCYGLMMSMQVMPIMPEILLIKGLRRKICKD